MNRWILLLIFACFSHTANAALKIDITEGVEGATPIAVIPFQWVGTSKPANADVSAIISSDLARSGKFSPVAEKDLLNHLCQLLITSLCEMNAVDGEWL